MKKKERLIIFETVVGSKLYGTNRPASDDDFMGVFIPSTKDMFSINSIPTEWSMDEKVSTGVRNVAGDIDRKFYSLQTFLRLAGEGQPKQIEMLFSPKNLWIKSHPIWENILENKDIFISENAIKPFIGFAEAQMKKSVLKGDNLNLINDLILFLEKEHQHSLIGNVIPKFTKHIVQEETLPDGISAYSIVGRKFSKNHQVKVMLAALIKLKSMYGKRSEMAAQAGVDYKSLVHAYRLIFQAEMLMKTGILQFPLPKENVDFLMPIREGKVPGNFIEDLGKKIEDLKSVKSILPKNVDWNKIQDLSQKILMEYFS